MALAVSPLAVELPALPPIAGVRLGAAAAGIRYKGRNDLVMAEMAPGTTASRACSPPTNARGRRSTGAVRRSAAAGPGHWW